MLEIVLLLLLLQVEYFQSPGLPRQYSLLALDAEAGEDRKAFNFIFINYCKKERAYSVHTDRSGRGGLGR